MARSAPLCHRFVRRKLKWSWGQTSFGLHRLRIATDTKNAE
jgi:hypothetical protein